MLDKIACTGWRVWLLTSLLFPLRSYAQTTKPADSRFTKVVLDDDLNEPMEVAVAPDGIVYYVERPGWVNRFDPAVGKRQRLAKLPVRFKGEDGLMGLALDPNFSQNRYVYLYFGDPKVVADTAYNVLARFVIGPDSLLQQTRRDLLRIPVVAEGVSHSGGSLAFDRRGNLYLSTGDNTNPFESDGYAPTDDRPGRQNFDAGRSAGNPADLRGKILRIRPVANGTYAIPEGNLFPPGTPGTKPEIYVMGCRNPYRIDIDPRTGVLYWGEVGPDAGRDSLGRGPRGHDEFNRAARAGNFGWPYFVGNSKPYHRFDFASKQSGTAYDPLAPVNESANNTGLRNLPPVQPALIWYPYDASPEFPALGTGGRNAIGGPVYYPPGNPSARQFPAYYEGAWFIADWMRNWIFTARVDSVGKLTRLEPFLPNETFSKPIDMTFGPEGALYLLEYGAYWRAKNTDARLVRIEYTEGNRTPIAKLTASRTVGAAPLRVQFSASDSFDYDGADSLTYRWQFTGQSLQATGKNPAFTFTKPGTYTVRLTVTDPSGSAATNRLTVRVGNEPPRVSIRLTPNRSFYFGEGPLPYRVHVTDREDGQLGKPISSRSVRVTQQYLPTGYDFAGLDAIGTVRSRGQMLMAQSDCGACHAPEKQSVGPSWQAISRRYDATTNASVVSQLGRKVINGGGGVWGREHVMSAHPQLSEADAGEMVRYILSLRDAPSPVAPQGALTVAKGSGRYLLTAEYTDKGGLTGRDVVLLRSPRVAAQEASASQGVASRNLSATEAVMAYNEPGAWLAFNGVDLSGIQSVTARLTSPGLRGQLELRLDSPTGQLVGVLPVQPGPPNQQMPIASLNPTAGVHNLYVVYKPIAGEIGIWRRLEVAWLEFGQSRNN
ncbi:PQQ-dependent sugar dehydrogenase [Spirosoma montaniterrae]|uniref:PKD domain-containing protein n=1 Tax=Spirosoma montaniterrae TaxID=1178516 RepID=A0A1P9WXK4_9BACT|nr:PQQ-dependent sugar dehydrogenase [Spirosoma montaniterrae]AQG80122.1 PKD domain-containing protein [Spirosoma montaniterrae]